jgi:hypothetical protein
MLQYNRRVGSLHAGLKAEHRRFRHHHACLDAHLVALILACPITSKHVAGDSPLGVAVHSSVR